MNIVTCLCLEKTDKSHYDQLFYLNYYQKFNTYWKCVVTFFSTSVRCNPNHNHYLFTNYEDEVIIDRINIKEFLLPLGVKIEYLPFSFFRPPAHFNTQMFATFYKLEVIDALAEIGGNSILMDSDCIWNENGDSIEEILTSGKVILYDGYKRKDPFDKGIFNLNMDNMGQVFKEIDSDYPVAYPVWFGGEIIGASKGQLREIAEALKNEFLYIINKFSVSPKFENGSMIFDTEEFFISYVYNKLQLNWVEADFFFKRIWSTAGKTYAGEEDLNSIVWHMIGDKTLGIPEIYKKATNLNSEFWKVKLSQFNRYLGEFLGIPERKIKVKSPSKIKTFIPRVKSKLRKLSNKYIHL